jgi:ABC-type multidrug transport system ATPase subunit/pSer/pThr/pTyr-binding forkhead associated (FHA) protein
VIIGRDGSRCDIVLAGATVSRCHVRLCRDAEGRYRLQDLHSTNGVFVNGARLVDAVALQEGDLIGLGTARPHLRFQHASSREPRHFSLPAAAQWLTGRSPQCDLVLSADPMVSACHATLRPRGDGVEIEDNHSLNGTWINGTAHRRALLTPQDTVIIGSTQFCFHMAGDGTLVVQQRECGQAVHLEGIGLTRHARRGHPASRVLLDDINLSIAPGELVAILGPSGAGKTTLLSTLGGVVRPDRGRVLCNGTPLDTAPALFRNTIGYVPQDDILHTELTVAASLDYTARLRLSPDLPREAREEIVDGAIETLGLQQVRHQPIQCLSGGQRKRVSIGAELLVRPGLLFLDEPTSGLDPATEERLMRHFRILADRGTTVVLTTHGLANLDLFDKVILLAQGRLVFCGTPQEALAFFGSPDQPLPHPAGIFTLLTGEDPYHFGDPADHASLAGIAARWADRYRASSLFQDHVAQRLSLTAQELMAGGPDAPSVRLSLPVLLERAVQSVRRFSPTMACRSWAILARRHLHIRTRAPQRLLLLVLVPVLLALVTLSQPLSGVVDDAVVRERRADIGAAMAHGGPFMEAQLKRLLAPPSAPLTARSGAELLYGLRYEGIAHLPVPMSVLLMIVMTAAFSGTLIAALEIAPERSIYLRERRSYLRILPYLAAKLPFCLGMTALQCLLFLALCWLHPIVRQTSFIPLWVSMVMVAWTSVTIGLALSAADPSGGRSAVMLAIGVVLPQLLLSGGLGPDFYGGLPTPLRWAADLLPARWGLEMVCTGLFGALNVEGARWIPAFIRENIGFDFGGTVYYSGIRALSFHSLCWLLCCAGLLRCREELSS